MKQSFLINDRIYLRAVEPEDMDVIAEAIALMLKSRDHQEEAKALVKGLTDKYPLVG